MNPKKKLAVQPEIPKAKKKARESADKAVKSGAGKSIQPESNFPIVGIGASAGRLEAMDISERKQAEDALLESEEKYRQIVETAGEGIWMIDTEGNTTFANQKMAEMLNYSVGDMLGVSFFNFMDEDGKAIAAANLERRRQGINEQHDFKFRRKDGTDLWAILETNPIRDRDGRYAGALAMITDITERKQAEDDVKQSQALRKTIIDSIPGTFYMIDAKGQYVGWNAYQRDEIVGQPESLMGEMYAIDTIHPDDRPIIGEKIANVLKNGTEEIVEGRVLLRGGPDFRWFLMTGWRMMIKGSPVLIGIGLDITERKQMEDVLRESEEKFKSIANYAVSWESWFGPDGKYIWVNPGVEYFTGYSAQEILALPDFVSTVIAEEDRPTFIQRFQEAIHGNRRENFEFRYLHKNGVKRWLSASWQPIYDTQGNPLGTRSSGYDITDRKLAEEKLRESELKLQDVFSLMQEGMALNELVFDEQGEIVDYRILEVNPAYERISTLTHEQVIGKKATEIYGMSSAYIKEFWRQNQHAVHNIITEYYVPQTNQWRTISTSAPVDNKFTTMFSDITDRKLAEDALRESADLLEKTIFSLLDAVLIIDADTVKIVNCNPAASAIFGYSRQEMLGQTTLFLHVNQASLDEFRQHLYSDMEAGKDFMFLPEFKMKRKDGTVFISEHSVVPLINKQGRRTGWVSVVRDITERKRAEEEIHQLNVNLEQRVKERTAELARANRAKDEFLANMSHELRTPLNGILGNAEILLEGVHGSINQKQSQSIETIHSSGQHLLNLINDILDVSKIESGKFELHPESISVQLICESSLTFIKQLALKKSIKVEYNPSPSASAIFADPIRLKQILVNLLSNAVKFTPENGNIKLEAWKDARSDQFEFSITDSGIGITPEDQQKLFKSFVQLDSGLARQHEGSGLGLALVRQLVEMHGGSVGVKSEPGKGSCFHFTIPARSTEIQAKNKLPAQLNPEETEAAQRNGTARILVVEDSATNMMITSEYLSAKGYQILEAHNGLEAIKYAHEQHLDLILMDIQMPGISGIETIKQLRAEPKFASLPIIALTALAMPGDRELCLEAGATEYLSKPVSLKKLIEVIGNLLNKQIPIE